MRIFAVLGAIILVSIIMNEEISTCRFLKVQSSYMQVSTVLGAIVLVSIIMNEEISACVFELIECVYMLDFTVHPSCTRLHNKLDIH